LGYKQYFERSLIAVYPPEFTFYHDRPTEPNGYKVIPFKETTSFEATEPVDRVVIHDARGSHNVDVRKSPDS